MPSYPTADEPHNEFASYGLAQISGFPMRMTSYDMCLDLINGF